VQKERRQKRRSFLYKKTTKAEIPLPELNLKLSVIVTEKAQTYCRKQNI